MSPRKRKDDGTQQLAMSFDQPEPEKKPSPVANAQPGLFDDWVDNDDADDVEQPPSELVTTYTQPVGFVETESVNATVAMAGLSAHTQRAYQRWITRYLAEVNNISPRTINLKELNIEMAVNSLGPATLKAWLGSLKAKKLGKQSIMQAKASIVWMAQLTADIGRSEYSTASGLSRVKAPRAESGQREGTWLTQDEVRQLLRALRKLDSANSAAVARNSAIIIMMVTCGMRRDEIATATWADLSRQGRNAVLRVHGKGEKLRTVKLPDMAVQAIEAWKVHHPNPEGNRPLFTRIWKGGTVTTSAITDKAIWLFVIKAAKLAGLPRITPHDLRRSFARGAYEAGVSFELIRQSLGHSNIATTERYVNSVLELDHAATDIWADTLGPEEGEDE